MNIMKTNMLLLDNRIKKDDAENTTATQPVPAAPETKSGMKALMFQGMQNLMANPSLAKQVGVMNEDSDDNKDNNSSNIAFKGVFNNTAITTKKAATVVGNKMKQYSLAGIMMASTLLPSALTLTSCKDREEITNISVTVNVDQEALMSLIAGLQSTLTQALLNQQISIEQFNKYMEQTEAWRKQVEQRLASFELILSSMADNIFNIDNNVKNGFDENNVYQKMIIGMLEQFMTRDEAIALFNKLFAEVAAGNMTVAQALAKIMEELNLVNQNLNTIIANQDRAYEQQAQVLATLGMIEGNTAEARDLARAQYEQLGIINNTIVDGNNKVVASINHLDGDMKAGFAATAYVINMSTQQLGNYINKGVMTIVANNNWNAMMVKAAIDYNTKITKEGNALAAEYYAKFEAGMLTAEELAQKLIEIANDVNNKMDTLIESFNSYAENMQRDAKAALIELRKGNLTAAQTRDLVKGVISNQQKAYAMLLVLNQNVDKLDKDVIIGNIQIMNTLKWLGYTEAQIAAMDRAAIINAIKGASNKLIATLGGKIDAILDNMGNGTISEPEGIAQIIALLEQIAGDVSEIKAYLAEFTSKFDDFAEKVLKAHAQEIAFLKHVQDNSDKVVVQNQTLNNKVALANIQLGNIETGLNDLKKLVKQLEDKLGRTITAEELDSILKEHDADNQAFYAELFSKTTIDPKDYTDALSYITALIEVLVTGQGQTNQNLLTLIELAKKYPEYKDMIIEAINNIKVEVTCQHDCDNNNQVTEGVITIVQ